MKLSSVGSHDRPVTRFVAGIVLLLLALAMGAVGISPAAAQEEPLAEGDAEGDDDAEPLEIDSSTLYVSPLTDTLPPTLTQSVPPAAVCVVAPELCPEVPEPLPSRGDLAAGIREAQGQGRDAPVQPVPADSAAVSFFGGVPRYQTAIAFEAPAVPEGDDVMRYELTFPQSQPTYDASSPAFRRAVLAAFEAISARDPAVFADGLAKALQESPIDTSKLLAFEACPLLAPFQPGGAPQASDEEELPKHEDDGRDVAAIDCTFGGNGVYDEEADVWRVDLAFTAQAWADGELDNHGVLLRPIGAPNLAFGDADTTTNAQLVLDLTEVTAVIETAEAFEPGDFEGFPDEDESLEGDEIGAEAPSFEEDTSGDLGSSLDSPDFPAGDEGEVPLGADAPEVADGMEAGEPEVALDAQAAAPAGSSPTTPWWVWLAAPLLLGGAYLTASSVLAPAPVVANGGGGALTRMLAKHTPAPTTPTQI